MLSNIIIRIMKKRGIVPILIVVIIIAIAGIGILLYFKSEKYCPGLEPNEWHPDKNIDCTSLEFRDKCKDFCTKHLECCKGELFSNGKKSEEFSSKNFGEKEFGKKPGGGEVAEQYDGLLQPPELPGQDKVLKLTRKYPTIIKAINEGPAIYSKDGPAANKIIEDTTIEKMKESGFNTVQLLVIDSYDYETDKFVLDEFSKSILLNDIVKIKEQKMAVWVATEYVNAPPGSDIKLPAYETFKPAYLELCKEVGALMEEYKVEYITVNNEPDLFFQEQAGWGTESQINNYVAEILPLANSAVKETFSGMTINKVTQVRKRPQMIIDASFETVDIASVDVGPPPGMDLKYYQIEFEEEYQTYASASKEKNVPWMVGEYWAHNFHEQPNDFTKQHQIELANASFNAYLKTNPKSSGYTWNDFSSFSFEPNGEKTRIELKLFLEKIS